MTGILQLLGDTQIVGRDALIPPNERFGILYFIRRHERIMLQTDYVQTDYGTSGINRTLYIQKYTNCKTFGGGMRASRPTVYAPTEVTKMTP